jgi:hypothetical protein
MPNFYYTDVNGQKHGAITPSQLKELVAQGLITPDTLLETDTGKKGKARQIKGLFPVPVAIPMPSNVLMADTEGYNYDYRKIAMAQWLLMQSLLYFYVSIWRCFLNIFV